MSSNTLPNKQTITSYGSVVTLIDAVPRKDPSSEWSAAEINPLRNDVAALTQTPVLCHFQVMGVADGYAPVVTGSSTWSSGIDQVYTGTNPTFAVVASPGQWSCTMPSSVQDSFLQSRNINLHGVKAWVASGTTFAAFICTVTSSNTFTVQIQSGGSPSNLVGSLIQFDCS
jgi:hypothetical protein